MEMEQLEEAYTHLESASPEQLRAALTDLARDPQLLTPLLTIAASESQRALQIRPERAVLQQSRMGQGPARRYLLLAGGVLAAGTVLGGVLAGRACSQT